MIKKLNSLIKDIEHVDQENERAGIQGDVVNLFKNGGIYDDISVTLSLLCRLWDKGLWSELASEVAACKTQVDIWRTVVSDVERRDARRRDRAVRSHSEQRYRYVVPGSQRNQGYSSSRMAESHGYAQGSSPRYVFVQSLSGTGANMIAVLEYLVNYTHSVVRANRRADIRGDIDNILTWNGVYDNIQAALRYFYQLRGERQMEMLDQVAFDLQATIEIWKKEVFSAGEADVGKALEKAWDDLDKFKVW